MYEKDTYFDIFDSTLKGHIKMTLNSNIRLCQLFVSVYYVLTKIKYSHSTVSPNN